MDGGLAAATPSPSLSRKQERNISPFRLELEAAVLERHCANHPMTEKWAQGELSRRALMGWAVEHYHWTKNMPAATFYRCAKAPPDVRNSELRNRMEEDDPQRPHRDIV